MILANFFDSNPALLPLLPVALLVIFLTNLITFRKGHNRAARMYAGTYINSDVAWRYFKNAVFQITEEVIRRDVPHERTGRPLDLYVYTLKLPENRYVDYATRNRFYTANDPLQTYTFDTEGVLTRWHGDYEAILKKARTVAV